MNNFTNNQKIKLNHQVWMLLIDRDTRAYFNKYWNLHLTKKYVKDLMDEKRNDDLPDYMNSYTVLCILFGKNNIDEWVTDTAESEMDFKEYDWH